MSAAPGLRRSEVVGLVVGLTLSALALALALRGAGWHGLQAAFGQAELSLLAPAAALHLISLGARAASWFVILDRQATYGRVFATLCEGYLMNNLLPGRVGELGRSFLLGRRTGLSPATVLASIGVERLFDIGIALTLLIGLWPLVVDAPWALRAAQFGAAALILGAGFAIVALRKPQMVDAWLTRLPGKGARWRALWGSVQQGLQILRRPSAFAAGLLLMAIGWSLAGVEYGLILRAFVPSAPFVWALLALAVSALSAGIPSAPGSLGVFEAAAVAALAVVGVPASAALAFALTTHSVTIGITTPLGAIALAGEGQTLLGVWRAARARFGRA